MIAAVYSLSVTTNAQSTAAHAQRNAPTPMSGWLISRAGAVELQAWRLRSAQSLVRRVLERRGGPTRWRSRHYDTHRPLSK